MIETIIVVLIIAVVVLIGIRSFYRALTRKEAACSCGVKRCPNARPDETGSGKCAVDRYIW